MPIELSILLVSWNTRDLTLRCLDSVADGVEANLSHELIVVDNGSVDGSGQALEQRGDISHLIRNGENRGYAGAVNQAYVASSGELVLLLGSDVAFQPGSVSELVRFLRERPEAAGVAPLFLNPDGTPQQHYFRLPTFWTILANSNALLRRLPPFTRWIRAYQMMDDDFSQARPVPQPSASCLLLRRSCLPAERVFDEQYPVYFNDVALARDLSDVGLGLWMTPEAVVLHVHGASGRLLGGNLKRQHLGALVRYLAATESRPRVLAFQATALVQGTLRRLLGMSDALPVSDLWRAVSGDPGPLPQAPSSLRATLPLAPEDVEPGRLPVAEERERGATPR
jgi:GT2 family glycosyltransferase